MLFLNKADELKKVHTVSIDTFGNAVPNVPSIRAEGSSIAASIVETREIRITRKMKPTEVSKSKHARLMEKIFSLDALFTKGVSKGLSQGLSKGINKELNEDQTFSTTPNLPARKEALDSTDIQYIPKQQIQAQDHRHSEFVQLSFEKLQTEFDTLEEQLDTKFQALQQKNQLDQAKKNKWFLPIMLASAIGGGYMLYILTNMQSSMNTMSASIPVMNQHIGSMALDTQAMNLSMQHLNGNVGQMNQQVHQMNQQMGGISQSIKPMGEAAATTQPFLGAMRSFMPF